MKRMLTTLEQNALRLIVIEYKLLPNSVQVWEDVITGQKITIDDVLHLVSSCKLEVYDAFEEGQIEEGNLGEYPRDESIRISSETSSSSISGNSEKEQEE